MDEHETVDVNVTDEAAVEDAPVVEDGEKGDTEDVEETPAE